MKLTCRLALVAALATTSSAEGQDFALEPRSRVRLSLRGGERVVGEVVGFGDPAPATARAIVIELDDRDRKRVTISKQDIVTVEVSHGRRGAWWRSWLGAGLGWAVGMAVGSMFDQGSRAYVGDGMAFGGAVGALAGGIGGYTWTPERWTPVPRRTESVSLVPARGRLGAQFTLRF